MSDFELSGTQTRKSIPKPKNAAPTPVLEQPVPQEAIEGDQEMKKEPEYSKEELLEIFDHIIFSNEYSEEVMIRNRLKVTFRTRTAKQVQDIDKQLDTMGASLVSTVETARAMLNLENAIVTYHGTDLSSMKSADRTAFIQKLPGPIIGALMSALGKFDRKVFLACQEGETNF